MKTNRRRINSCAVCTVTGDDKSYERSRKAHREMLQRNHVSFTGMILSGELVISEKVSKPQPNEIVLALIWNKWIEMPFWRADGQYTWKRK